MSLLAASVGLAEHTFIQIILRSSQDVFMWASKWRFAEKLHGFLKFVLLDVVDKVNRQQRCFNRLVLRPQSRVRFLYHAGYDLAVVAFEELLPNMLPQFEFLQKTG